MFHRSLFLVLSSPRTALFLIITSLAALPATAETYIIPLVASGLYGSDGRWHARATAVNGNSFPVTWKVTRAFPFQTEPCPTCTATLGEGRVEPLSTASLGGAGLAGRRMIAGALEVETSAPLSIHLMAYRSGLTEIRQRLDIGRRWLAPRQHQISTVERTSLSWRINVFVTNPNDEPVTVAVWAGSPDNQVHATVDPRSTAVVAVPLPRGPFPTDWPPSMIPVSIDSPATIFASASSLSTDWAVFSIADEARE